MKVYVFGNEDIAEDNLAFALINKLQNKFKNLDFVRVLPNEDLPFANEKSVVILDTLLGINKPVVFNETDLDKFTLSPRTSVHDFDLGFQLKFFKKIGKLGKIKIIGLPQDKKVHYHLLSSILRKLVAQDIQGS